MVAIGVPGLFSFVVGALFRRSLIVDLDYASYRGFASINDGGVVKWLGMRYAAPPIGDRRFAAPQEPLSVQGVQNADRYGKVCVSTGSNPSDQSMSEDCLFIDVHAPAEIARTMQLPVYFFIQGGGFNSNANPNKDPANLIRASGYSMLVVTFNYRVGPYGFLASNEVQTNGSLNNGLKDQRKALQWVKKYISQFGGDPDHIVVGGDSAGAGSIALHLTAYGGRDDKLFNAVAAESPGFPYLSNVTESQFQYDGLVKRTGCAGQADSLACLRNLPFTALQSKNIMGTYRNSTAPALFSYGPVIDEDLVPDYTYRLIEEGKVLRVPAIFGVDTNDGTVFAPRGIDSQQAFDTFLKNNFPSITEAHLSSLHQMYPATEQFPSSGRYWRAASNAYGEMRYACPALYLATQLGSPRNATNNSTEGEGENRDHNDHNDKNRAWLYLYNVTDSASQASGMGVTHTAEIATIWNTPGAPTAVVPVIQSYWISFIRSFDPSADRWHKSAAWTPVRGEDAEEEREQPQSSSSSSSFSPKQLVFQAKGNTNMAAVSAAQQERCAFLWSIGVAIKQ